MLTLTGIDGRKHYLAPSAIAEVSEAGASAAWHGIRAFVRTFDGRTLEVQEDAKRIATDIAAAGRAALQEGGERATSSASASPSPSLPARPETMQTWDVVE